MEKFSDYLTNHKNLILLFSTLAITTTSLLLLALLRLAQILPTPASSASASAQIARRPAASVSNPTHLLIVLGSGGHTAEMLNIISSIPDLPQIFTHRTYLVSSGDSFSAAKAVELEKDGMSRDQEFQETYSVVTVRRARRVHQSFFTTPVTALQSLYDCVAVLRGTHEDQTKNVRHAYPDLILTNGPGTGVCVVLAALLLRFFGYSGTPSDARAAKSQRDDAYAGQGQMRTIFIESWARVKTLSLSGKILQPLVNRFLVQWPQLAEKIGEGVEYIGPLVT